jgi:hypothetical protein
MIYLACAWALWASGAYTTTNARGIPVPSKPYVLDYFEQRGHCMLAWERRMEREEAAASGASASRPAVHGGLKYRCLPQGVQPTRWD